METPSEGDPMGLGLTLTFMKISKDFTAERHVNHELKGDICSIILKGLLLAKKLKINYQLETDGM